MSKLSKMLEVAADEISDQLHPLKNRVNSLQTEMIGLNAEIAALEQERQVMFAAMDVAIKRENLTGFGDGNDDTGK